MAIVTTKLIAKKLLKQYEPVLQLAEVDRKYWKK